MQVAHKTDCYQCWACYNGSMQKEQIMINGQPIGKLKAGWLLFKETWRYFKADTEMMWIPLVTTLINLFLFGLLITGFYFFLKDTGYTLPEEGDPLSAIEYSFIFLCYVIGAFSLALTEAGITNTVYTRVRGGDATLGDSLKAAFSHWASLLVWSFITSTVGLILRMIAERSKIIGRIIIALLGVAWSVLTYFVVPAMVIDKKSAFSSIGKSGQVFKTTWGETLVSNISIGVVFSLVHVLLLIAAFGLMIFTVFYELWIGLIALGVLYCLVTALLCLVQSSMNGILKTLLYVYASEGVVPANFNQELLEKMLTRQKVGETAQS